MNINHHVAELWLERERVAAEQNGDRRFAKHLAKAIMQARKNAKRQEKLDLRAASDNEFRSQRDSLGGDPLPAIRWTDRRSNKHPRTCLLTSTPGQSARSISFGELGAGRPSVFWTFETGYKP